MSFDGVFIHNLLQEITPQLIKQRINKVNSLDQSNFILSLSNQKHLLIIMQADSPHLRMAEGDFIFDQKTSPLLNMLKKHLEGAIIKKLVQKDNDRLVMMDSENENHLGAKTTTHLIMEFFGRNANLILVDAQMKVIECAKKIFTLGEHEKRIMLPKLAYTFPQDNKLNPFLEKELASQNLYSGVSALLYQELIKQNSFSLIHQTALPTMIKTATKNYFYCFDLPSIVGERTYFPNLSALLEHFYVHLKAQNTLNVEQKLVENFLKKEITKLTNKLEKQKQEQQQAETNLIYEQYGNLLQANLYRIQKGDSTITVANFYNHDIPIEIPLDPLLEPTKNLHQMFAKYKKAKRTLIHLQEQIELTKNDLQYFQCLENQARQAKKSDLTEIMQELGLGKSKTSPKKKTKPLLLTYEDHYGHSIIVGKNNVQNNYLTHSLAKKHDYFFHVKDAPGSHTILQAENPSFETLNLAAEIAAFHSPQKHSGQVAVDYTLVKNVKKVPKMKGSFVTYTKQKTLFVTPDWEHIKTKIIKKS
ncbi:MAG TPA: NFACT family protein [Bacilli bacterium]|nr:MAG: hypothetical protein BWY97_00168 [Tenericutes bacterium ADurb.BinA124]HNZ50081.1 NFACT family protein [Bacilli bacterium]HOH17754.1 NFACT family protein [Bacilli bacterium]HPX83940.1 NFACT family protein [Bacilli bacterium]HQC74499.1 NFACT family protein [Bacilli bacterium]